MAVIFGISSINGPAIDRAGLGSEPLHIKGHFFMFVVLCVSYFKATKNVALSVFLTIIFGLSDEFHQKFVPFRSASFFDVYVDSLAAIISGLFLWKLQPILPKQLRNWLNK